MNCGIIRARCWGRSAFIGTDRKYQRLPTQAAFDGLLLDGFKIRGAVLAQGADDVIGQGIALVHPTADLADVALLALHLRLGLHVLL